VAYQSLRAGGTTALTIASTAIKAAAHNAPSTKDFKRIDIEASQLNSWNATRTCKARGAKRRYGVFGG
jgi:hypothetical protein